jgi:integrase
VLNTLVSIVCACGDKPIIRIRRGAVRVDGQVIIGTPKSEAGIRDVAIPPHLIPMLKDHLNKNITGGKEGLLFSAAHGGTLAPSTLYKSFYPARDKAGRPCLRWHDLRHTGAVLAAQTGATLAELMGRLGHSTPSSALRYQHAAEAGMPRSHNGFRPSRRERPSEGRR